MKIIRRDPVFRRIISVCFLAMTGPVLAGGLLGYEISSTEIGLASAGYGARGQDASTVLSNPAAMTRLDGTNILINGLLLYGDSSFSSAGRVGQASGGNGGKPIGWLPGASAFVSHSLSPALKVGFGMASNFGGLASYDDDWVGRYYVKETTLLGLSLLPSVAYRVDDKLSLGATLNATYGVFNNKVGVNNVLPGFADGALKLKDNTWGWGLNLGALYEFSPSTRLGLVYTSRVKLDFEARTQFLGLAPGLSALLASRGLLDANIDLGLSIPQSVMLSGFHQLDSRWAVLGSLGWQDWSRFGKVDVAVESSNPTSLTTAGAFKDTWHVAAGAQYRPAAAWTISFGLAYDSEFQEGTVSPALPVNSAWRFGVGAQMQSSKDFSWNVGATYLYGGTLDVSYTTRAPVATGGRGNLAGSYDNTGIVFLSASANWKF
ncbi:MAG: outer membrane protein transport protein [Chitinophagaceae bacterium]|nr:outer membrane protein transport protein [Rubrivivax sp.]